MELSFSLGGQLLQQEASHTFAAPQQRRGRAYIHPHVLPRDRILYQSSTNCKDQTFVMNPSRRRRRFPVRSRQSHTAATGKALELANIAASPRAYAVSCHDMLPAADALSQRCAGGST